MKKEAAIRINIATKTSISRHTLALLITNPMKGTKESERTTGEKDPKTTAEGMSTEAAWKRIGVARDEMWSHRATTSDEDKTEETITNITIGTWIGLLPVKLDIQMSLGMRRATTAIMAMITVRADGSLSHAMIAARSRPLVSQWPA